MYKKMKNLENQDNQLITEYTKLVGSKLANQLVYGLVD